MNIAGKLKKLRKSCLMTQGEFAQAIGVSFSTVNRWENGKTEPNIIALKKIDDYCKGNNIHFSIGEEILRAEDDLIVDLKM